MSQKFTDAFEYWTSRQTVPVPVWEEPDLYDAKKPGDRRQMYSRIVMGGAAVRENTVAIANDLFELHHPDQKFDPAARDRFTSKVIKQGNKFGTWAYLPWSNQLVQFADEEEHWQLLTNRNRELISQEEQRKLSAATLMFIGLSVGSLVLDQAVHMGMGGTLVLVDPDTVSIPNLNRIQVGMTEVGMHKTDVAGIRVSEVNPYVKQIHVSEGLTKQNVGRLAARRPDIVYEHADHLPSKLLARRLAAQVEAALIMATDAGENSLIDVERHDRSRAAPFNGRLSATQIAQMESGMLTPEQTLRLIIQIVGHENISVRMAQSLGQIGVTLGGFSQLGTTASAGAAYAAKAGKDILLGPGPASDRYTLKPHEVFKR
jgi:molybdopterin/thiamine biosynthesis adenylyltransferase